MSRSGPAIAFFGLLFALVMSTLLGGKVNQADFEGINLEELPSSFGPWSSTESYEMDAGARQTLKLDNFIKRLYTNDKGQSVFVYVGYWKKQSGEHQAAKHSPVTCLPSNGWKVFSTEKGEIGESNFLVNKLTASFKNRTNMFYYWFFSGEETYLEEWKALFKISMGNLLHGRSDGGIIEMSASLGPSGGSGRSADEAEKILNEFAAYLIPALKALGAG